jgi:ATP phosphoribosyltransferase regulatory subunit
MAAIAAGAESLGFDGFKIAIGQVEFFRGIMDSADFFSSLARASRGAIGKKDVSALRALLENEPVADAVKEELGAAPPLGGPEVLAEAERRVTNDRSRKALDNIAQVLRRPEIYGVSDYLTIDLGEIRGLDYYTGVT